MDRKELLDMAAAIVTKDRNTDYGEPEDAFGLIASLWTAYLKMPVTPQDVAVLMVLLKIARIRNSPNHKDSWVDMAGYTACGGEIACRDDLDDFPDERNEGASLIKGLLDGRRIPMSLIRLYAMSKMGMPLGLDPKNMVRLIKKAGPLTLPAGAVDWNDSEIQYIEMVAPNVGDD